ncbi:MAG: ATP-binding cassette domain-containing protein, partial [Gammaproteobacteria bacterium]|nr:ATP-binding cassette domain-containing protein [Gammaproteobacteria bacterium]
MLPAVVAHEGDLIVTVLGFCELRVAYGEHIAVESYNDILHSGEWVCVIGPNGAGKSSVLRAAAGLIEYTGS